jgi:hypothetical protein
MVNICPAAPAIAEEGERPEMLGTEFDVSGVEELPPPPPPQERQTAKESVDRMQITTFSGADLMMSALFFHSAMPDHLTRT